MLKKKINTHIDIMTADILKATKKQGNYFVCKFGEGEIYGYSKYEVTCRVINLIKELWISKISLQENKG